MLANVKALSVPTGQKPSSRRNPGLFGECFGLEAQTLREVAQQLRGTFTGGFPRRIPAC
jgi:hypothetical protein